MTNWVEAITNLGNLATAVPVAALFGIYLGLKGRPRLSVMFGVCFLCAIAVIVTLKFVFRDIGNPPSGSTLFELSEGAPSGHAGVATILYGCALSVFLFAGRGVGRVLGVLYCAAAMIGVWITRVTLHTHTIADVLAGLAIAGLFAVLFGAVARREAAGWRPRLLPLLLAMVVLAVLFELTGLHFTSNEVL